jgi:hypothetical protein
MAQPMLLGPGPFSGFSNAQPPTLPLAGFVPSFFPSTPTGFPPSMQPPPFYQGPSPVQPFPQGFFPAQSPQDPSTALPFSQDYFHAQSSQGLYPAPPTLTQSGYPSSAPFRPTSQRGFFGPSMCAPAAASLSYSSSVPSVGQWGAPSQMDMDIPIAKVRREKRRSRTPPRRSPREGRRTRRGESRSRSRSPRRGGAPDREERCDIIVPEVHLRDATGCLDDVLSGGDWYRGRSRSSAHSTAWVPTSALGGTLGTNTRAGPSRTWGVTGTPYHMAACATQSLTTLSGTAPPCPSEQSERDWTWQMAE